MNTVDILIETAIQTAYFIKNTTGGCFKSTILHRNVNNLLTVQLDIFLYLLKSISCDR